MPNFTKEQILKKLNPKGKTFQEQVAGLTDSEWKESIRLSVKDKKLGEVIYPEFPDEDLQKITVGSAGEAALRESFLLFDIVKWFIKDSEIELNDNSKLLDFGVGFGRIYRMFLKDFKDGNIIGTDVSQDYIDTCQKCIPFGSFLKNNISPPFDLDDESIDVITSYSVFSHLSEKLFTDWQNEFYRVLKPGGIAVFTVRSFNFILSCNDFKDKEYDQSDALENYFKHLGSLYSDLDSEYEKFNRGEFLYPPVDVLTSTEENLDDLHDGYYNSISYSESVVPPRYLFRQLAKFDILTYINTPQMPQAVVVLRKPAGTNSDRIKFQKNNFVLLNSRSDTKDFLNILEPSSQNQSIKALAKSIGKALV
jgi:ubiquinone/menaquinone biosynthesis C-methylase UbiE